MKMVRSLLLGSAAGLVAVTAGQAADLPVKAKPVQYVKICSLYGAGFYYMPGTDMCLKIGGWVRAEATWGINGSSTSGIFNNDVNNRLTNNLWTRERGYITADAREQTAYGVARGYIAVGVSSNNNGNEAPSTNFSSNRAYVQWAGFTAGLAVSFFDFYPAAAYLYRAGNIPNEDTGDGGWWVWAYTAQLGGGVSASFSAEERRTSQIIGLTAGALPIVGVGTLPGGAFAAGTGYGGWQNPDYVANIRVDQAWGSAQISGAAHQLNPVYYDAPLASTSAQLNGHPGDQWGWVVNGGIKINTPMIAPGDNFIVAASYTQGATKYLFNSGNGENLGVVNGNQLAYGVGSDCVYAGSLAVGVANATGCLLTTAWGVDAAYEHYWTPQWHQSLVFNYMSESYGNQANALLCSAEGGGNATGSFILGTLAASPGCNNNWQFWGVGSRLQWDVTKSFYIGVEAIYQELDSATAAGGLVPTAIATSAAFAPGGVPYATQLSNESNWTFTIRMHKDFLP
jgi:hypothetical protein